jgi:peptidoglycan/LPS O-acetylase OafA/YrhL
MLLLWWLPPNAAYEAAYFELPAHCEGLLCGSIVAVLVRERSLHALRPYGWIAFCIGFTTATALIAATRSLNFQSNAMSLGIYPAVGTVFASVVLLALIPGTVFQRFGELRSLRFVGRYSYGMYVYHLLFAPLLAPLLPRLQHRLGSEALGGALFVLAIFVATLFVAIASYEFYEKRFLAWKKYFPYAA